jgi:NAD(P)-dependent dehydrogenase (short-subunit alcohol dehydrogenase family)
MASKRDARLRQLRREVRGLQQEVQQIQQSENPDAQPSQVGRLRGKVAVVTGASRGIGLAIATALAAEECDVALMARDTQTLKRLAATLADTARVRVIVKKCDVRNPASVESFFAALHKRFPRIDFLINNAGIAHRLANVSDLSIEEWRDVIDTNLNGMFYCTRAALPLMSKGGAIVNNLSIAATTVFTGMSAYDASKHGGLGLTNTLREELRDEGIRVIALIIGSTSTDIWDQFMPEADRETMMSPASVATAVVNALCMPPDAVVEEIRMMPLSGTT